MATGNRTPRRVPIEPKRAALRALLLARRTALLQRIARQSEDEQALLEPQEPDVPDRASEVEIARRIDGLSELERAQVGQIDLALARLIEGRYGRCASCGDAISKVRLSVMPETTLCWDCAVLSRSTTPAPRSATSRRRD
jgi:RNA polymerase-binding transcription factor DksA